MLCTLCIYSRDYGLAPTDDEPVAQPAHPPSTPGRPVAEYDRGIYVTLQWTQPDDDGGTDITGYVIKYRGSPVFSRREDDDEWTDDDDDDDNGSGSRREDDAEWTDDDDDDDNGSGSRREDDDEWTDDDDDDDNGSGSRREDDAEWTDDDDDDDHGSGSRREDDAEWTDDDNCSTVNVAGNTTQFQFTDELKQWTRYQFAVAAVNAAGQGQFSLFSHDVRTGCGEHCCD